MTLTKERQQRHDMRKARLEILAEIDDLDKLRCKNCYGNLKQNAPISQIRCGCYASVKIRELANIGMGNRG